MNKFYSICILLIITSCGGGGGGGGSEAPVTPAPTVSISADPLIVLLTNTSTITWSSSGASSCSASGSWSGTKATSGSEVVTISTPGNNTYTLSCTGAGGTRNASVIIEGYRNTDGVIVDGYIRGAEVFVDEDSDWIADSTESATTSDNDGKFTIKYANGHLVSIGGTDLDSSTLLDNLLITHKLTGHTDFKAVTPVTSVAAFMTEASNINSVLGIDSSIDITSFDPVANKGDGGVNDFLYEKGNQLTVLAYALQNITNDLNITTETTQDYFKAISEELEKEYTETSTKVDIETEGFVVKVLENIITEKTLTISDEAKANTAKALSGVMPVLEIKTSKDLTTSVIRFGLSTLQTDIKTIANGTAASEMITSYSEDILAYIAADQSVDANDITPNISAIADAVSTDEDTSIEINALANDSYVTNSSISLSILNGSNGSASATNNVITYVPNGDYNGSDTFTYSINQGDKTSSADVSVTINPVNDAPLINTASTLSAPENQTALATILVSDVDTEDTLTLSLGGTDAGSFDLSSENILTFKEAPDYETKTSYAITLSLTDETVTVTKDIEILVTNVNDVVPEFTSEATFSVAENQTSVGIATATDAEGDLVTFTNISGSELEASSDGVITFVTAPDYETKSTYTATLTINDGVNDATQDITVTVTDVNEAPLFTSASAFSVAENQTSVGIATATDAEGDLVTFTNISGSELEASSDGVITFVTAPDYETKSTYTATLTINDGVNDATQDITVTVTDVNEAPLFTSASAFSADEQQLSIGTVVASDQDGNSLSFSMLSGDDLTIDPASGVLTFKTAPDYETTTSITDIVKVTDGSLETTQSITISINETQFEVSGVAYASKYLEIDGDIPNIDYLPNDNSNNFISGAQTITNPALVTGFTGHTGDDGDIYKISTSSNMFVNLDVVDYANGSKDLDVSIWEEDGSSRSYSYVVGSNEANETINLPSSGTYLIYVRAVSGSSKYYLTVGQRLTNQSMNSSASTSDDYVKNEIISYIPFSQKTTYPAPNDGDAKQISSATTPLSRQRTPGLRKLKPIQLISNFKNQLSNSNNNELIYSQKQLDYLSHWKAKEKLKDLNPLANYELNYYVKYSEAFSPDPYYSYQWNLKQINLESALNGIGQEVKNIAVAVIDTGSPSVNSVAWNATNFISGGYDFVASTSNGDGDGIDNDPTDLRALNIGRSHGTHVATTIGLKNDGNNFNGMAVKVLPLRVFPNEDIGASRYDIKQAILYAAGLANDSGAVAPTSSPVKVINLSLGGSSPWDCSIFSDVAAQGISVVAASGNDGDEAPGTYNYPASCANVISVGSTNSYDEKAYYSQYNNMVDMSAPGGQYNIDADADGVSDEVPAFVNDTDPGGMQGTSMASPTAAGGIALLYSVDSDMTPAKVNSFIQNGYITDDIGTSGYDTKFGYGRLNVAKAIENTLSNIGNTSVTYMTTNESYVDFGNALTQVNITLRKIGGSELNVSSLSADDASGLSYTSSVDSEGVGTYTIYMDRGSIPNGEFQNRLYFNLSNSTKVSIGAYYRVGADKTRPNLGKAYVGLYNSSNEVIASGELNFDGALGFVANDIEDGKYYFIVSTDIDDDNNICGYGELCEYYPEYGSQVSRFTVSGSDTSNAEIYISPTFKYGGINAASTDNDSNNKMSDRNIRSSSTNKIKQINIAIDDSNIKDGSSRIPRDAVPFNNN